MFPHHMRWSPSCLQPVVFLCCIFLLLSSHTVSPTGGFRPVSALVCLSDIYVMASPRMTMTSSGRLLIRRRLICMQPVNYVKVASCRDLASWYRVGYMAGHRVASWCTR